ncbi:MAG: outer membrane protein assembly factor BamA [Acidobacteriota bacterium]
MFGQRITPITPITIILLLLFFDSAPAQQVLDLEGRTIRNLQVLSDGPLVRVSMADMSTLIQLEEGQPFSYAAAKSSIQRLNASGVFFDVQIEAEPVGQEQVDVSVFLIREYLIRTVDFEGNVRLNQDDLLRNLVLREGEPYSDVLMEETLARLQEAYQLRGYYQATIRPEFQLHQKEGRLELEFEIEAGEQARVASLELDIEGNLDQSEIRALIQTSPSGRYSQLQMDQDIEAVERYLSLQGYLRPDVYITDDGPVYNSQNNTVSIVLRIIPREYTEIQLVGISLDDEQIRDLVLETPVGVAGLLTDQTREGLIEYYQERGYFNVKVDYQVLDGNAAERASAQKSSGIQITVEPGAQYQVSDIAFTGNQSFSEEDLAPILGVTEAGFFSRGEFSDSLINSDLDRIRNFYRHRGYRDVQVSYETRAEGKNFTVIYEINEGPRYYLQDVEIIGNEAIDEETLLRDFDLQPGDPFSPFLVAQGRTRLITAYENRGYREMDYRIETSFPEPQRVVVTYYITEGRRFFTDAVVITGNLETRESVLDRAVVIEEQEPLSLGSILETETNLYNLTIFNRVQINEAPSFLDPTRRLVVINLEEAKRYTLLYGVGYSSLEGPRGTVGITDSNFLGMARSLAFGTRIGRLRQRATVSYTIPFPLDIDLPTILSLTGDNQMKQQRKQGIEGRPFDVFRGIASAQSEKKLSVRESLFFRYRFELASVDIPPDLAEPLQFFRQEERLRLSSLSLSYLNDSRDDPTNPQDGFFLTGDASLSTKLIGSDEQFFRILAQGQYYREVFSDVVLVGSLRLGAITPFASTSDKPVDNPIPISERFFSGGSTTLRGLPQDLAGPLLRDENGDVILVNEFGQPLTEEDLMQDPDIGRPVPLGGNLLIIGNLELRFPLLGFVNGALFYDVGNVFHTITEFNRSFSNAAGFGVRVNTPVGPLRVDIAYNPDPPDVQGFSKWNFHFGLGHPF